MAAICRLSKPNRHKFMPAYLMDSTSHCTSPSLDSTLSFLENSLLPVCDIKIKHIVTAIRLKTRITKIIYPLTPLDSSLLWPVTISKRLHLQHTRSCCRCTSRVSLDLQIATDPRRKTIHIHLSKRKQPKRLKKIFSWGRSVRNSTAIAHLAWLV